MEGGRCRLRLYENSHELCGQVYGIPCRKNDRDTQYSSRLDSGEWLYNVYQWYEKPEVALISITIFVL